MARSAKNNQGLVRIRNQQCRLRLTRMVFHRYRHVLSVFSKGSRGRLHLPQNVKICLKPMRWVFTLTLLVSEVGLAYTAAPTKPKSISPKSSHTTPVKPSQHSVSSGARALGSAGHGSIRLMNVSRSSSRPTTNAAVSGRSTRHTRRQRVVPAPSFQLQPDPDRYQEIQKALSDKGYFKGEVNGQWGDDSVDALKRFQADKGLTDDGKINALSLTGLGLGPKHDGSAVSAVPANSTAAPATVPANADAIPAPTASPSPPHPANRL